MIEREKILAFRPGKLLWMHIIEGWSTPDVHPVLFVGFANPCCNGSYDDPPIVVTNPWTGGFRGFFGNASMLRTVSRVNLHEKIIDAYVSMLDGLRYLRQDVPGSTPEKAARALAKRRLKELGDISTFKRQLKGKLQLLG